MYSWEVCQGAWDAYRREALVDDQEGGEEEGRVAAGDISQSLREHLSQSLRGTSLTRTPTAHTSVMYAAGDAHISQFYTGVPRS